MDCSPRSISKYLLWLWLLTMLSSCRTGLNLDPGVYELKKNKITIITDEKIRDRDGLNYAIESLILQKPDDVKFWNPRFYVKRSNPVIFDQDLAKTSAESIKKFLKNKKGFYNAEVKTNLKYDNNNGILVDYVISTGKRYRVKSISYVSEDEQLQPVLEQLSPESLIKPGIPLDAGRFDKEKQRLTTELQNLGYADFVSNYIEIQGDSSDYVSNVIFRIRKPLEDSTHIKYAIGDINVYTEHLFSEAQTKNKSTTVDDVNYHAKSKSFVVNPKAIDQLIFLNKGDAYSKENRLKTFRKLSDLSAYRYIYLDPKYNEEVDSLIDFDIYLTPHQHKWIFEGGTDVYYSTFNQLGRKLFGFGASSLFENRNLLGGSERYALNLEGTLEFNLPDLTTNSVGLIVQNTLQLPRYRELFYFSRILRRLGILKKDRYEQFRNEATTEIRAGYSGSRILDFYAIRSVNASWGYDYRPNANNRFLVSQIGLNLLNPNPDTLFQEILDNNFLLDNSFQDVLTSGFIFQNLSYFYQGTEKRRGSFFGFIGRIEQSGLEAFLVNRAYRLATGNDRIFTINNIEFAKFLKFEADGRMYHRIDQESELAFRLATGVVLPFGERNTIPYPSQFFVGGPNSIRAWQLRELGPGGYSERLLNPIEDQPFFQSGDFKFEFGAEYRRDLIWYIEGALFVDGGNVWTLDGDDSRANSKLTTQMLDQMAIGIGWGLRIDVDYFIIRSDFGYKLRNPFPDESGSHYALTSEFNSFPFGNINVAINYPF